jgi:hypothetical protein
MQVSPSSRSLLDSTSRYASPPLSPVLGSFPGPRLPPRPAHAAARRSCLLPQRRGAAARARPPSSSPSPPPNRGGGKPQWGGWSCLRLELLPSPFESTPRGFDPEMPTLPSTRRRLGPGGSRGVACPASDSWGERATGSFPFFPAVAPGPARLRRPWRARQPAGSAARPPRAGWRGWTGGAAAWLSRPAGLVNALKERERKGEKRD